MFKNVGSKIKVVSVLLLIAGILLSVYIGVFEHMLSGGELSSEADELVLGGVIIVVGIIASVIMSMLVNGFGVIVENSEKTEEIRDLLLEINNKKTDFKADNTKSSSILNSSFNNEVFDDREFSGEEPAVPEYVKPVSGHEVASSKYVAPTYNGRGGSQPTRPVFGTQNVGVGSMNGNASEDNMPEMPVRSARPSGPVRPGRPAAPAQPVQPRVPQYEEPVMSAFDEPVFDEPVQVKAPQPEMPVQTKVPQPEMPVQTKVPQPEMPVQSRVPQYEQPIMSAFDEPAFEEPSVPDEPGVYASPEKPPVKVLTPEEQERAGQIQDLIFKFVARRNGNVNINDILRTVPRNVEPQEFHDAVRVLEEQGRLIKNEAGDYTAIK